MVHLHRRRDPSGIAGGHRALWDDLETVHDARQQAGSPQPSAYTVHVASDGAQRIDVEGTSPDFVITTGDGLSR